MQWSGDRPVWTERLHNETEEPIYIVKIQTYLLVYTNSSPQNTKYRNCNSKFITLDRLSSVWAPTPPLHWSVWYQQGGVCLSIKYSIQYAVKPSPLSANLFTLLSQNPPFPILKGEGNKTWVIFQILRAVAVRTFIHVSCKRTVYFVSR